MSTESSLGSAGINIPPVWPDWLKEEVEKNKDWKFTYDPSTEPLLHSNNRYDAYMVRPIKLKRLHDLYKKGEASFWTAEEMSLAEDEQHWKMLDQKQRKFIKKVLIYFLSSDSGLGDNALTKFSAMIKRWEAKIFYLWQGFDEAIHSETYAMLVEHFMDSEEERDAAFSAIENDPAVNAKAKIVLDWVEDDTKSPHERLIAFGFVESVFFSGSFCSIGWIKQYLGLMPGLIWANDKISSDESIHCEATFLIYSLLANKVPRWRVCQIAAQFVEKEFQFIEQTLDVDLIGMNAKLMMQYIMFVCDITLQYLGYEPMYNVTNPFPWMDKWSMDGITNFFEKRNTEYQLVGVKNSGSKKRKAEDQLEYVDYRIDREDF